MAGVAWATFLCQGVSCILAMTVVFRRLSKIGKTASRRRCLIEACWRNLLIIAVPQYLPAELYLCGKYCDSGCDERIWNSGYCWLLAAAVEAEQSGGLQALTTLANGISNYTAQNMGAGKYTRVKEGMRAGVKIVWILSLPLFLLYFFAGEYAIRFFMNEPTAEAVHTGVASLSDFYLRSIL